MPVFSLQPQNQYVVAGSSVTFTSLAIGTPTPTYQWKFNGRPIKDATVEIWQCDAKAVYLHTRDSVPKAAQRDQNFQGFGRFTTGSKGEYRFRTIKPCRASRSARTATAY